MPRLGRAQAFKPLVRPVALGSSTAWTSPEADTTTLSDAAVKNYVKNLSDTTTSSDSPPKNYVKKLADTTTSSDAAVKAVTFNKGDTTTLSDAIVKSPSPHFADSTTLTDAIVKSPVPHRADTTTSSDATVKSYVKNLADSTTLSDGESDTATFQRSPADTTTLSDGISSQVTKHLGDTTTLSDVEASGRTYVSAAADTTTSTDAISNQFAKQISDLTALFDAPLSSVIVNESMDTAPTTGTIIGSDAGWQPGNYMRLTTAAASEADQFYYAGTLPTDFEVTFDFWTGGGTGADAVWFYWGSNSTVAGEDYVSEVQYLVAFDEYSGDNAPVQISKQGTRVAATSGAASFADSQWHSARITVSGGTISVYLDGVFQVSYTDGSYSAPGNRYGWGARTGGAYSEHRIRRLLVAQPGTSRSLTKNLTDSTTLSDATGKTALKHLGDTTHLSDVVTFPGLVGVVVYPHLIVLLDGNLVLQLSAKAYLPL